MKNILALVLVCFFLVNCASVNPYGIPEGEGAYLENTAEQKGKARFIYYFDNAATAKGIKDFEEAGSSKLTIPDGDVILGIFIRYFPEGTIEDLSFTDRMTLTTKALSLLSSKAQARHDYLTYGIGIYVFNTNDWEGIKINAVKGESYHVNSKIENGKAYIWVEDSNGAKVSETVRGYGVRSGDYWLWEDLPDPVI